MIDKLSELRFISQQANTPKSKGFFSVSVAYTLALFFVLFILAKVFLAYGQIAHPGQVFYPLKLVTEDVKIKFSQHPRDTAVLYGIFLDERLVELKHLSINPSPVYLQRTNVALGATEDTVNEILAGIFTGDIYFEPTVADNHLATAGDLADALRLISENVQDVQTKSKIEVLEVKTENLHSKLAELANANKRKVQAYDN